MYQKNREFTIYKPFNDGWFSFYYCDQCGNRELEIPEICPRCKTKVSNYEGEEKAI